MKKNAIVIIAACGKSKRKFAIRSEQISNAWYFTWAFKINESRIKSEGFDKSKISGLLYVANEYPGCPHCGATGFVRCGSCGKISCFGENDKLFTCPFCGISGETVQTDTFDDIQGGDL